MGRHGTKVKNRFRKTVAQRLEFTHPMDEMRSAAVFCFQFLAAAVLFLNITTVCEGKSVPTTQQFSGGCLSKKTKIHSMKACMLDSFPNLRRRIYEIVNFDIRSRKVFYNREGCLPPPLTKYFEYRLNPQASGKFRIVALGNYQIFYFTLDHYGTFFRIPNANFFSLGAFMVDP